MVFGDNIADILVDLWSEAFTTPASGTGTVLELSLVVYDNFLFLLFSLCLFVRVWCLGGFEGSVGRSLRRLGQGRSCGLNE